MFTSILCPVDFSEHSERALGYAIKLASLTGSHLTIVHVVAQLLVTAAEAAGSSDTLTTQTQQEIQSLLSRVAPKTTKPVAIAIEVGDPPDQILKQVDECAVDLIVMGTQGLEGARRLMFGSTTEAVLRQSRVPVLAVPAPPTD